MRHHMTRRRKPRREYKIESILERIEAKYKENKIESPSGHMTLIFTGFYDKSNKGTAETVTVEATLLKICHKKRKDISSPVMQISEFSSKKGKTFSSLSQDGSPQNIRKRMGIEENISVGRCEVPRNPDPDHPPAKATALSVPSDSFSLNNGHLVKSYVLLLRVVVTGGRIKLNGICNGELSDSEEPPHKKRKNGKGQFDEFRQFGAELVVYDKQQRCLLSDGEYQLVLQECGHQTSPKKSSWETLADSKEKVNGSFDVFNKGPLVTFHLTWNDSLINGIVEMPQTIGSTEEQFSLSKCQLDHNYFHPFIVKMEGETDKPKKKLHIFYQFQYNNNTRQQTEARDDLHCPWCSVNCIELYCLLKHLKLCHSRFIFTYVPHLKGARIDVSINECYDGSYAGNPHDLHSHTGFAFGRSGPVRRTPVTHLMVCRPKRLPPSLSEFLEPDDADIDGPRPYISGHNRLYYHTRTCLPVRPQEIDNDSESENDPEWLRIKTQHMIDEFTDVNEGEKELMKMWNLHVMKYGFVGDCQIPIACTMFVEEHGRELLKKNLYKNFSLHLSNMFDFGLISASTVYTTMRRLQKFVGGIDGKHPQPRSS
ncbi:polycomb protein suz12-like isoform X1 [Centruroides sculpturatus]|uniref:polycomb protein suz12-like isoform X1 n=1 Tax=Centruroides sculpturatus TaxID=218467 RepID=UPI000C6E5A67|nr:polycomb protein suz12-like isoform X1 [Centruroides sculpturatus]